MKKIIIIAIAVILCLSVIGGVFALYSKEPANKEITITAGSTARLTIGDVAGITIQPGTPVERSLTLGNGGVTTGDGRLTIELDGNATLLSYLDVTFTPTAGDAVSKATLTSTGVAYSLASATTGTLTVTLTCTDEQFKAVSNQVVTITINWAYEDTFVPVDGAWYLIGDNTDWTFNANAIKLDDTVEYCRAAKNNVTLAAGKWKAFQYNASEWTANHNLGNLSCNNNGDITVSAGVYNVRVWDAWDMQILPVE